MEGKQAQVSTQLDELGDTIDRPADNIGKLEERLSLVLRDVTETKIVEEAKRAALVPLADRVRSYTERIDGSIEALRDIMARLEL